MARNGWSTYTAGSTSLPSVATWLSFGPLWWGLKGNSDLSVGALPTVSFPSLSATLSAVSFVSLSVNTSNRGGGGGGGRREDAFVRISWPKHYWLHRLHSTQMHSNTQVLWRKISLLAATLNGGIAIWLVSSKNLTTDSNATPKCHYWPHTIVPILLPVQTLHGATRVNTDM